MQPLKGKDFDETLTENEEDLKNSQAFVAFSQSKITQYMANYMSNNGKVGVSMGHTDSAKSFKE
jgi:hypothetical protein